MAVVLPTSIIDLPYECLTDILKELSLKDSINFRLSCPKVNSAYQYFRKKLPGSHLDVFVNIVNGNLQIRVRNMNEKSKEAFIIPNHSYLSVLTNSVVNLSLRLGSNVLKKDQINELFKIFKNCHLTTFSLYARHLDINDNEYLKHIKADKFCISVNSIDVNCPILPKLHSLKISRTILFFEFERVLQYQHNILILKLKLTQAALPAISRCLRSWLRSKRDIQYWELYIPRFNLVDAFPGICGSNSRSVLKRGEKEKTLSIIKRPSSYVVGLYDRLFFTAKT